LAAGDAFVVLPVGGVTNTCKRRCARSLAAGAHTRAVDQDGPRLHLLQLVEEPVQVRGIAGRAESDGQRVDARTGGGDRGGRAHGDSAHRYAGTVARCLEVAQEGRQT
jgi:hypothetical protein